MEDQEKRNLKVSTLTNDEDVYDNCVFVADDEFKKDVTHVAFESDEKEEFVFKLKHEKNIRRQLKIGKLSREWAFGFSSVEYVDVYPYTKVHPDTIKLTLRVEFAKKKKKDSTEFNARKKKDPTVLHASKVADNMKKMFEKYIFSKKQPLVIKNPHHPHVTDFDLRLTVMDIKTFDGRPIHKGCFGTKSKVVFVTDEEHIHIIGQEKELIKPDFNFEDLGIGGLDDEFSALFRRAFSSRIIPPEMVEKLGVQHVKGLLLYGPPGTGKTLMARQIGKMLNAKEPKVVSGPEVLSKFVGQSEENVRKLFEDAEKEYKTKGEESGLHIIIMDELDAICKQRGSRGDSTGVGDSIVNQLLAKMDGVDQLNNILVIGMTNRKDMIDDALLRPGRFEVHIEVGLPDDKGRLQILKIHTSKMRENNILDADVSLEELADATKNYSGAEIQGLVKAASSYAFTRHIKVSDKTDVAADVANMKVNMEDFDAALIEVPPAFGVSEAELNQCVKNDIIPFEKHIKEILADGRLFVEQVKESSRTPLISILLHGKPGSGKTALAAKIALDSHFPFIKLISPETMVGLTESAKISSINKIFNDAYRSQMSAIVIDDIERLLDYVNIGPRFSNSVLQTLLVLIKKQPPEGRRLLILGTTSSRPVMEEMGMFEAFSHDINIPNVTTQKGLEAVVEKLELFDEQAEYEQAMEELKDTTISIGVKKLLMVIEMARQDDEKVHKFVSTISPSGAYEIEEGESDERFLSD